jgi:hypothetical protein
MWSASQVLYFQLVSGVKLINKMTVKAVIK